jgi:putative ABC transport system permease protein
MVGNIFKIAWRNIWRNKRRSMLTLVALAIGVMSMVFAKSYIGGISNSMVEAIVKTQTGHIRIAHKEFLRLERIMPKEYLLSNAKEIKNQLNNVPGVTVNALLEQIKFNVLLSHGNENEAAMAIGIVPKEADKIAELSQSIVKGKYFSDKDDKLSLIIGKGLSETLKVGIDDELLVVTTDINYSTYALPFKVIGIFETGLTNMDKHLLYIPLNRAQEMLDCGDAVHDILVFLDNPDAAIETVETIKAGMAETIPDSKNYSVIPWQHTDIVENALPAMKAIYGRILDIVMLIVALVILNTMLMAVMERYHEIGVMKALGFKNREIFAMILTEAFYIGAIGSIIGGILGGSLSAYLAKYGMDLSKLITPEVLKEIDVPLPFFGKILYLDFSYAILLSSMAFGLIIALIAVLYPAFKSARMQPVEAFRSELKI